jgi:asparagine synthase (glutamine-hydrolysing)
MQLEDEAYDSLLKATYFQDEPIMHLNEPHLFSVSQLAKPQVKVLSGEGADELMGLRAL